MYRMCPSTLMLGFRHQFQRRDAPSRSTLILLLSKWHKQGSVKDSETRGCLRSACTRISDNVERVRQAILRSPFHRDCRSVFNDMVVAYRVIIQTVNIQMNFYGLGMYLLVLINPFP
jgi:hypothetical protein